MVMLSPTYALVTQALHKAGQRSQRLNEALDMSRGNSERMDELLSWLTESHALLSTKMRDAIPDDLTIVESLLHEHMVCYTLYVTCLFVM